MNENITKVSQVVHEASSWFKDNQEMIVNYSINFCVAIIIFIAGFYLARVVSKGMQRAIDSHQLDKTVGVFLVSFVRYIILVFAAITALSHMGIRTTSFIAMFGAISLAIGLALQNALSNLAVGVLLIIFRPFRVGEYIDLGGVSGTVSNIQLFSTNLHANDGRTIVIPNSKIIANNIINYTRRIQRRLEFVIAVSGDSDMEQVKQLLTNIVDNEERIINKHNIVVRLKEMSASSLKFIVQVWVNHWDYDKLYFDLLEEFKRALDKNGIVLA